MAPAGIVARSATYRPQGAPSYGPRAQLSSVTGRAVGPCSQPTRLIESAALVRATDRVVVPGSQSDSSDRERSSRTRHGPCSRTWQSV
jgi:hypothetical protein